MEAELAEQLRLAPPARAEHAQAAIAHERQMRELQATADEQAVPSPSSRSRRAVTRGCKTTQLTSSL
jgi:hypothetical protein